MQKALSALVFFTLALLGASSITLAGISQERWELWPMILSAKVTAESDGYKVYLNPRNTNNILVYPGCISILRDSEEVYIPNCYFQKRGDKLYGDTEALRRRKNGSVVGVTWSDAKNERSLYTIIFRRPRFEPDAVLVYEDGEWLKIEHLPPLK